MNQLFTYSILQYKHSLLLREAVNVGVLFAFSDENKVDFVFGNSQRVKSIYSDFDPVIFNSVLTHIQNVLKEESNTLLWETSIKKDFKSFISSQLLIEDSTSLQFTEPVNAISVSDYRQTMKQYAHLLLPGIDIQKSVGIKHNEAFLLREYTRYLFENDKEIEKKISKNVEVSDNNITLGFEVSWKYETTNLVKPISFDLKEVKEIQNKSAQYFGYFSLLKNYATNTNSRFDILIAAPQDKTLFKEYDKAINTLYKIDAPKKIILQPELKKYSQETRDLLNSI